ncbi:MULTISPECIES: aldo/keto reductase [unclassified Saccharopolyspora]|uniref:aldo/keto reductase n=1 Tax=unclassified Saccharopolyspora TaxID=2646250 RepID=UPI001CD801F4|nr:MULTISPECIES: aldo/keto reductase [unclassified Saccharopolyspora]MCA1186988.1 aldo/keto reductase [Saccharopolyspora sp. 6T]MCA1192633.1 aldo/keto reductase [Saccharopolyspora sp. 6V]MCA1229635.1 aldo/keto reductase [Saccharopolyspora sp. 6M]MCA1283463.1 aldo/keto reductase [Saccharopolyspora sp. 7B]
MHPSARADRAGTITIGGDLDVARLGFGTMRLPGPGIWGPPRDHDEAIRVIRRAVDLGVTFIDTADSYGPAVAEELIKEALHPYPDDLVIATKAGLLRPGPIVAPGPWPRCGRPDYLKQQAELSLRRLGVERLDLFQLHRVDETVPFEDQIGALADLRAAGKVRHVGLSGVSVAQLEAARSIVPIVAVQNRYNLTDRSETAVLDWATSHGIAFIPFAPLSVGALAEPRGAIGQIAATHGVPAGSVALAWLLKRSPMMLPIPGTSTVAHLEENIRGAALDLSDDELDLIGRDTR